MAILFFIIGGLFLIAGIFGGVQQSDFGMMGMGIALGILFIFLGIRRNNTKDERLVKKELKKKEMMEKFLNSEEGKKYLGKMDDVEEQLMTLSDDLTELSEEMLKDQE
jgi:hypothetical protein